MRIWIETALLQVRSSCRKHVDTKHWGRLCRRPSEGGPLSDDFGMEWNKLTESTQKHGGRVRWNCCDVIRGNEWNCNINDKKSIKSIKRGRVERWRDTRYYRDMNLGERQSHFKGDTTGTKLKSEHHQLRHQQSDPMSDCLINYGTNKRMFMFSWHGLSILLLVKQQKKPCLVQSEVGKGTLRVQGGKARLFYFYDIN